MLSFQILTDEVIFMTKGRTIICTVMCVMFALNVSPASAYRLNRRLMNDTARDSDRQTRSRYDEEDYRPARRPPRRDREEEYYPEPSRRTSPRPRPEYRPASRERRNALEDWHLSGRRPSVTLRTSRGQRVSLFFRDDGDRLVIDGYDQHIPRYTRFTVPYGYVAFCDEGDTVKIEGVAYRVDYGRGTKIRYEEGAELEYTEDSGLVLMPLEYAKNALPVITPPDPRDEREIYITPREYRPDYERKSTDPEKVIPTYELPRDAEKMLIQLHKDALKLISKPGRIEAYTKIFDIYDGDFLAAYYAGLAEFDSNNGRQSKEWCEVALAINPHYLPAKLLMKRAEGLIKGM